MLEEIDELIRKEMLLSHSRVMIMMFEATGDVKYLDMSINSLLQADLISDFNRPLGVLLVA